MLVERRSCRQSALCHSPQPPRPQLRFVAFGAKRKCIEVWPRDHIAAAKFYSEVLGCRRLRSNERYSFIECGGSYFVLAKIPHHVNPNNPGEDAHHHAFMVAPQEFDRVIAIMKARGIELVKYSDEVHTTFPGRHAYFHDPDGNGIEIVPKRTWSRPGFAERDLWNV